LTQRRRGRRGAENIAEDELPCVGTFKTDQEQPSNESAPSRIPHVQHWITLFSAALRSSAALRKKKRFFGHFRDAARVGLGLATTRPSQRHPSWETAIELTTKTARQRQLRALLLVSLLEPIFEKDAIEARCFAK